LQISQIQNEEQEKSIPEAAIKDKLREISSLNVISSLVKSLDDRDSPVLGWIMTRVGTPLVQRSEYRSLIIKRRYEQTASLQRTSSVLFIGLMA